MNATPASPLRGSEQEERVSGKVSYLAVLERLHRDLEPKLYLEIGVRHGGSLRLAQGPAIGVDPAPALRVPLPAAAKLARATSDAFFASPPERLWPDFGFIDGMHLFEFALRDFINFETCAAAGAIVAVDDVFPNHSAQAERERRTRVWTGDVWRLLPALRRYRPDLQLIALDTHPTGLLLIANLDRKVTTLLKNYERIVDEGLDEPVPDAIVRREGTLDPTGEAFTRIVEGWKARRVA
jgi:hypothetical protein